MSGQRDVPHPVEPGYALAKRVIVYLAGEPGKKNYGEPTTPEAMEAAGLDSDAEVMRMALGVVAHAEATQHVMTWAELDDLFNTVRQANEIVFGLHMMAEYCELNSQCRSALQTVAQQALRLLNGAEKSLEGYCDLVGRA